MSRACSVLLPFFAALVSAAGPGHAREKKEEPTCITALCHAAAAKGVSVHAIIEGGECSACHEPAEGSTPYARGRGHRFKLADMKSACFDCHDKPAGAAVHKPAGEGDCLKCHDPHASKEGRLLRASAADLCRKCHGDLLSRTGSAVVHGAARQERACLNCHLPHAGASKLLAKPEKELCLGCHGKEIAVSGRTIPNIAAKLRAKGALVHDPVASGDCSGCHFPHSSEEARLLRKPFAADWYAPRRSSAYELCFECHDAKLVEERKTTGETEFRDGDRNLHSVHVLAGPRGRSCVTCHDVHAAGKKLIAASVPFYGYAVPVNWKPEKGGGSCLPACHEMKSYSRQQ